MIKADWQLWAFCSGSSIKIWTAASLWGASKLEIEKLKDKMNKFLNDKKLHEENNIKAKVMSKL